MMIERELAALVEDRWSSVDATLQGLRAIDAWSRERGDLRGVFAAAYAIVTAAIAEALALDLFDEPEWVSRVVLDFVERYRGALHADAWGDAGPTSWAAALRRTRGGSLAAIVALLHAMIAHIHYDLAHALHACAPIDDRRRADYERLGAVIGGSTPAIQRAVVDAYAPELRALHRALRGADTRLTAAVVQAWRSRARQIAEQMGTSPAEASVWSRRLDVESAALAVGLDVLAWPAERLVDRGDASRPTARAGGSGWRRWLGVESESPGPERVAADREGARPRSVDPADPARRWFRDALIGGAAVPPSIRELMNARAPRLDHGPP